MKYKINTKVLFKTENVFNLLGVGSNKVIGIIVDTDGDFYIIKTGLGELYINKKDILKELKGGKKE